MNSNYADMLINKLKINPRNKYVSLQPSTRTATKLMNK